MIAKFLNKFLVFIFFSIILWSIFSQSFLWTLDPFHLCQLASMLRFRLLLILERPNPRIYNFPITSLIALLYQCQYWASIAERTAHVTLSFSVIPLSNSGSFVSISKNLNTSPPIPVLKTVLYVCTLE